MLFDTPEYGLGVLDPIAAAKDQMVEMPTPTEEHEDLARQKGDITKKLLPNQRPAPGASSATPESRSSLAWGEGHCSHDEGVPEMGARQAMVSLAAIMVAVALACILVILITRYTGGLTRRHRIQGQLTPLNKTTGWPPHLH
ncbi:uncharacterized protein LOC144103971 [Amblyomma americanum]